MAIILGIDPGSRKTGYGVIQVQENKSYYMASGCIHITSENKKSALANLFLGIQELIETHQPTEAAIEQIFVYRNPRSALVLGQARGVALMTLQLANLPVWDYAARQVKQSVVGYGAASKTQIQYVIKQLLHLNATPQADAADALAIALCHAQFHSTSLLMEKESK